MSKHPDLYRQDIDCSISVAVSIDGTWQKMGYSSKYGVVLAILVDTGEVVDLEVLSLHCHKCKKHQHDDKASDDYKFWKRKHELTCHITFEGSSGGMKSKGGMKMVRRSLKITGLKYVIFVGGRESDTFNVVHVSVGMRIQNTYCSKLLSVLSKVYTSPQMAYLHHTLVTEVYLFTRMAA